MIPLMNAALDLATRGFRVFPLRTKSKHPATKNGHLAATSDPRAIAAWWGARPTHNIGIALGPDFVAIDVDPRNDGTKTFEALESTHGPAPAPVATQRSGRGDGGYHLIYRLGDDQKFTSARAVKTLGPGVDVKFNGYVVAAPSIHPDTGQPYTIHYGSGLQLGELNDTWFNLCFSLVQNRNPFTDREQSDIRGSDQDRWEEVCSALPFIPAEERETWISVGMALHSMNHPDALDAWDQWSQGTTSGNYQEGACERAWASFKRSES